jgi:hypothetical protein
LRIQEFPYRYADAVLTHRKFKDAFEHLKHVLTSAPVPLLSAHLPAKQGGVKSRKRKRLKHGFAERIFFLPVDQKEINAHLESKLSELSGWEPQPLIVRERPGEVDVPKTRIKGDYKRANLQVEVQFGNMARWYSDVFKFQLGYSRQQVDVGVLVVPTVRFANLIDENVACFERVIRELPWAKMSLTLPIMVLGVEPEDYSPLKARYNQAFEALVERERVKASKEGHKPKEWELIPFDSRLAEPPAEEEQEVGGRVED